MNLVDFLGWEYDNGIYRSKENGEFYRVVDNRLETFAPIIFGWKESKMPINMLYKLRSVDEVGFWSEGFKVQNKEDWELVKHYYSQKGLEIYKSAALRATEYVENNTVFYAFIYYGKVEITTSEEIVKRDLVLKPIKYPLKFYAKYVGEANFGEEMYWRIDSNGSTVSLLREKALVNWHDAGISDTLENWKRCGITTKNAVFTTASGEKVNKMLVP